MRNVSSRVTTDDSGCCSTISSNAVAFSSALSAVTDTVAFPWWIHVSIKRIRYPHAKGSRKIDAGRGFTDPALLIAYHNLHVLSPGNRLTPRS